LTPSLCPALLRTAKAVDKKEAQMDRTETVSEALGDLVVVLLAGTLAGLRDRLAADGLERASELVAELTERCDSYIEDVGS
jgi:hypothetical protein